MKISQLSQQLTQLKLSSGFVSERKMEEQMRLSLDELLQQNQKLGSAAQELARAKQAQEQRVAQLEAELAKNQDQQDALARLADGQKALIETNQKNGEEIAQLFAVVQQLDAKNQQLTLLTKLQRKQLAQTDWYASHEETLARNSALEQQIAQQEQQIAELKQFIQQDIKKIESLEGLMRAQGII